MASKRQRESGSWEFVVRNKALPAPAYLTFPTEEAGDEAMDRIEAELWNGRVPPELLPRKVPINDVRSLVRAYCSRIDVPESDRLYLGSVIAKIGSERLDSLDEAWADAWVSTMKAKLNLAPSTIRHYVGALARCLDWAVKRSGGAMTNPLRSLSHRYASYAPSDVQAARKNGGSRRGDTERDRRLSQEEEKAIRANLERLDLPYAPAMRCMFDLAIESAMRMSEIYTLSRQQVDVGRATIFLMRTKNGRRRQVPLTTVARAALATYFAAVESSLPEMQGFAFDSEMIFPWCPAGHVAATRRLVSSRLSTQWGRVFDRAGCPDFTFHDLRHEATSRFFERTTMSDVKIASITGHKDPRKLLRYANLRATKLAEQMW